MFVSREFLMQKLPPDMDTWVVEKEEQVVKDIINGMYDSYPEQASWYDDIGMYFKGTTLAGTCDNLYNFCKENIEYYEEGEEWQSIPLPNGILNKGYGDCKTYASFIGGCLGAIARATGENIDWAYCFASYKLLRRTPYHVFVVVNTSDGQIWVDPTPGSSSKAPVWYTTVKPYDSMALMRQIAGVSVGEGGELIYQDEAVGAIAAGSNVPTSALPLPDGYPANLPRPAIVNGKFTWTGIPPNFSPNNEQVAWMMIVLQLWVYVYSDNPYDVFKWNTRYDNSGLFISDYISRFCQYARNPDYYYNGKYGWWTYTPAVTYGKAMHPATNVFTELTYTDNGSVAMPTNIGKGMHGETVQGFLADRFDFLNPPPVTQHSWIDDVGTFFGVLNTIILKYVAQLFPVVGTAFANAWNKALNKDAIDAANQQYDIDTKAAQIVQQIQVTEAADAKKKKLKTAILLAAAVLAGWWIYENE